MSERKLSTEERARVADVMAPWSGITVTHPWTIGAHEAAWARVAALVREKADAEASEARVRKAVAMGNGHLAYCGLHDDFTRPTECPACELVAQVAALREALTAPRTADQGEQDEADRIMYKIHAAARADILALLKVRNDLARALAASEPKETP